MIQLRGVAVHNLKQVDLDLPHRKLVVFCGVSGSGKTSLALDTLYAEGQRRYIESFSAYTRQFLERLEKPAAERIDGIPPAIAVTHKNTSPLQPLHGRHRHRDQPTTCGCCSPRSARSSAGNCGTEVRRDTPQSIAADCWPSCPPGTRFMVAFPVTTSPRGERRLQPRCRKTALCGSSSASDWSIWPIEPVANDASPTRWPTRRVVVVDRLTAGSTRSRSGCATRWKRRFAKGEGAARCSWNRHGVACYESAAGAVLRARRPSVARVRASARRSRCDDCGIDYPEPEPRLFSFNSPLGACPTCEGFGNVIDIDMDLVVPDRHKSIRDGAIAPWNTPAYAHELEELLAWPSDYGLPVDVPFSELTDAAVAIDSRRRARARSSAA